MWGLWGSSYVCLLWLWLALCTRWALANSHNFTIVAPPSRGNGGDITVSAKAPCGGFNDEEERTSIRLASTVIVHVNERQRGRLDLYFNKRGGENVWRPVATLNVDSRTSSVHMWADFNTVAQAGDKGVLQVIFSPFVTNITDWEEYYDQVFSDDDDEDDDDVNNVDVALAVAASKGGDMESFQGYSMVPLYQCADIELVPGKEDRYYEQEDDDESGSPEFKYSIWRAVLVAMGAVAAFACLLGC